MKSHTFTKKRDSYEESFFKFYKYKDSQEEVV